MNVNLMSFQYAFLHVNYNNSELTINCINSILSNNENSTIIVVDNNSEETEKQKLKEWQSKNNAFASKVTILYELKNLGYFGALNIGLELIKNEIYIFDYVTIGNNDLIFDVEYFNTLASNEFTNDIFVIAPNIIKTNGIHQNPYVIKKTSFLRKILYHIYYSHFYFASIILSISKILNVNKSAADRIGYETSQYIYAGHGACYILTKNYFKHNFLLDDSSFLMGEEFLLAKQIRDTGGRIYYNHNLRLIHNEHSTMDKIPSEVVYSYMQKAHKLIWRLY